MIENRFYKKNNLFDVLVSHRGLQLVYTKYNTLYTECIKNIITTMYREGIMVNKVIAQSKIVKSWTSSLWIQEGIISQGGTSCCAHFQANTEKL